MRDLVVSELFGPTLQGEGPGQGEPVMFLRLGGCNLRCLWCDTPYTWDAARFDLRTELATRPTTDVLAEILAAPVKRLVVSGGEPLLQQGPLAWLIDELHAHDWHVEIETAGTVAPVPELRPDRFVVSPKLASSGNDPDKRRAPEALAELVARHGTVLKFVVASQADLDEVDALVGLQPDAEVWLMPEGSTAAAVLAGLQHLAPHAIARNWRLSSRLHVLVWGNRRAT